MSSNIYQELLPEFDSIKSEDETILWIDKPLFIPFVLSGMWVELIMIVFAILFLFVVAFNSETTSTFYKDSALIFGVGIIVVTLWNFTMRRLSFRNTCYACSDKRILIRTGFIAPKFKVIDLRKIIDVTVSVSIIERRYQAGTVLFYSGRTDTSDEGIVKIFDKWQAVPLPYAVFKRVCDIVLTDRQNLTHPNAQYS